MDKSASFCDRIVLPLIGKKGLLPSYVCFVPLSGRAEAGVLPLLKTGTKQAK